MSEKRSFRAVIGQADGARTIFLTVTFLTR